jgi:hypothetical protein
MEVPMSMNSQSARIEHLQARGGSPAADADERTVLRLSRESLREERPAVRFVDRVESSGSQQRLPWLACG